MKTRDEVINGFIRRHPSDDLLYESEVQGIWKSGYYHGYTDGMDAEICATIAYRDYAESTGRTAAWEAAKKVFSSMSDREIEQVFPEQWENGGFKAIMELSPKTVIEKLKAYEENKPPVITNEMKFTEVFGPLTLSGPMFYAEAGWWEQEYKEPEK